MLEIGEVTDCPRCGQYFLEEGDERRWDVDVVGLQLSVDKKRFNIECKVCGYITHAKPKEVS